MKTYSLLFIIYFLSQSYALISKESVPVLVWSTQRKPLDRPAISAIPIPFSLVQGKYLKSFNQNDVILFLQDTLSVEDLASHEDEFKHVEKYMENGHSLYLTAMEVGISVLHSFALHGYNVITLEPGSSIGELKLKKDAPNLVVVKIPSTKTNPSRKNALKKADEIIDNVLSKVGKSAKFTVIYTGSEPSIKQENRSVHRRTARAAGSQSSSSSGDPKIHIGGCSLLYLKNDILVEKSNNTYILPNNDTYDVHDDCGMGVFKMRYTNIKGFNRVAFKISFAKISRHWTIKGAELSEEGGQTVLLYPQWPMEYVPLNKSWACGKKLVLLSTNMTDSKDEKVNPETLVKVTLQGIQMEVYIQNNRTKFNDAWDCVGFFTIPIWMGLFAAIILTLILIFGMIMLMDIKTMDRFDDPKGKHFMVSPTAE